MLILDLYKVLDDNIDIIIRDRHVKDGYDTVIATNAGHIPEDYLYRLVTGIKPDTDVLYIYTESED